MTKSLATRPKVDKPVVMQKTQVSPTPAMLLGMAIEKGIDAAQLKDLMDLQDRWEKKEAKKAFLDALAKFQLIVPNLPKNKTATIATRTGGSYSYKYADLSAIDMAIKKPLNECGLSKRWEFAEPNGKMVVTCIISHRDGHSECTTMEGEKDDSGSKNNIQQKGSTHTYLQRYTLIGALGLSTGSQDNDATGTKKSESIKEDLTDEEIQAQWKEQLSQVETRIALTALYMKNKKSVDANQDIKDLFNFRREELPPIIKKSEPVLP